LLTFITRWCSVVSYGHACRVLMNDLPFIASSVRQYFPGTYMCVPSI